MARLVDEDRFEDVVELDWLIERNKWMRFRVKYYRDKHGESVTIQREELLRGEDDIVKSVLVHDVITLYDEEINELFEVIEQIRGERDGRE